MTKPPEGMSQGYSDAVDAISRAIADWMEAHPGARPRFKFPPPRVVMVGELNTGLMAWSPNEDAQALMRYVDDACEQHEPSMLQFQVCFEHYQKHGRTAPRHAKN